MSYKIKMSWDGEAAVWIATSDDVPGLVLESESLDALFKKVRTAVPELLELNGTAPSSYSLDYQANRSDTMVAYG